MTGAGPAAAVEPPATDMQAVPTDGAFLHFGPGALMFSAGATVKLAGTVIPGGTVKIDPNGTLITELGYRWGKFGLSITGGFPPLATVSGAGSLSSLKTLGRIRYGPTVVTAHYHFTQFARFQPYLGGGPVFLLVFANKDGAIQHLDVHGHVGAAVQAGAEYALSDRWFLFGDAKKAWLRTTAAAELQSAPVQARIRLDPVVVASGLSCRF